jgi:hypothetical protein
VFCGFVVSDLGGRIEIVVKLRYRIQSHTDYKAIRLANFQNLINSMGDLEVIYWTVKSTGLHSVAISRTDSGTAVRSSAGDLEVENWAYALSPVIR